ncbi:hypothetical protein M9Y10_017819 [Tritrichomonas musculus]|uniref:Protein kinase domain-containing protein n=1 Tax=Tritrichomonas musculus TaxID=1915356 RepID=A0ABR2HUX9_9EUKA
MFNSTTQEGYKIDIPSSFKGYNVIKQIGNGGTCIVVLIEDQITKKKYAAKVLSKTNIAENSILESINKEINVLKSLSHPNIIKVYDSFDIVNEENEEEFIVIIMEYCEKGDLLTYINNIGFKNDKLKRKITIDFLKAIQYLHNKEISHGDIKAENILLNSKISVKLCDFGFCRTRLIAGNESKKGTLIYAPPEMFQEGKFNTLKADIYSIGLTLYSMSEMQLPFTSENQDLIVQQILNGFLSFPIGFDKKLEKLIKRCTSLNPLHRPSIEEILKDDYFLDNDSNQINKQKFLRQIKIKNSRNDV